jgi:hypothetical protein
MFSKLVEDGVIGKHTGRRKTSGMMSTKTSSAMLHKEFSSDAGPKNIQVLLGERIDMFGTAMATWTSVAILERLQTVK